MAYSQTYAEKKQEEEANMFAVNILLPTKLFKTRYKELTHTTPTIPETERIKVIAKEFQVDEWVVVMKLMYLQQFDHE